MTYSTIFLAYEHTEVSEDTEIYHESQLFSINAPPGGCDGDVGGQLVAALTVLSTSRDGHQRDTNSWSLGGPGL